MPGEGVTCVECGMAVRLHEYHPFAACVLFKAFRDGDRVRLNLRAVMNATADYDPNTLLQRREPDHAR